MLAFDVRAMPNERREYLAWLAHESKDRNLPRLSVWNYEPCATHGREGWLDEVWNEEQGKLVEVRRHSPKADCDRCGILLGSHQKVGALWLYLKKKALLADTTGAGKSAQAGALIAMMIETGELSFYRDLANGAIGRVIIIPTSPTLGQWEQELLRMMPTLNIIVAAGGTPKAQRLAMYQSEWQVLLIGPEMFRNDHENLRAVPLSAVIVDDVDALRHYETSTSTVIDNVGRRTDRYVIMNATPMHKNLMELHSVLDAIGGEHALGGRDAFERMHVDRRGSQVSYRRMDRVKTAIAPLVLRRTAADLDGVHFPGLQPTNVILDLYPRQRDKYRELQSGVIELIKDGNLQRKRVTAMSRLTYGAAICAGMGTLGGDFEDGPGMSVKLDWFSDMMDGDFSDEKVVIFANRQNSVRDIQFRLRAMKIGFSTIWGVDAKKASRSEAQRRFREDDNCQVLIGTQAIERGLNLQIARHLVNVDMIMNQARMHQLAGRIRRIGSSHHTVFVHNLLTSATQEERYLPLLKRETALADHIWGEESELFDALTPLELLQLITG